MGRVLGDGEGSVSSTFDPSARVSRMMGVGKTSCEIQLEVSEMIPGSMGEVGHDRHGFPFV